MLPGMLAYALQSADESRLVHVMLMLLYSRFLRIVRPDAARTEEINHVEAEAIHALCLPEINDLKHFLLYRGVRPVKIDLLRREFMVVKLAGVRLRAPGAAGKK